MKIKNDIYFLNNRFLIASDWTIKERPHRRVFTPVGGTGIRQYWKRLFWRIYFKYKEENILRYNLKQEQGNE